MDRTGYAPDWVGPTGQVVMVTGGLIALRGGPRLAPVGIGLLVVGAGLVAWDWSTTPQETVDEIINGKDVKELDEKMQNLQDLINQNGYGDNSCPDKSTQ